MNTQRRPDLTAGLVFGILAVLLAFAIRLWGLNTTSLWYDEAFMLIHARQGILQAVAGLFREDNALPLHGLLLAIWIRLVGDREFTARYLSVLLGTIGVPLVIRLSRAVAAGLKRTTDSPAGGRTYGVGAGLAYAALPILVYYGQEVRMYALAIPLATGFTWAGWHLLARRNRTGRQGTEVAYVTLGLLMMAAHLFAGLAWAVTMLWGTLSLTLTGDSITPGVPKPWITRLKYRAWWRANLLLAVLATPIGIWAIWRVQSDATAVSAISSEALRWIPILFGVGQYLEHPWPTVFIVVSLGAILASLIRTVKSRQISSTLWLLISLTLPITVLFLMTTVKAKWSERYLLPSWGISLVVAIGLGWEYLLAALSPRRPRTEARPSTARTIAGLVGLLLIVPWVTMVAPALERQAEGTWAVALQDEWHPRPDFRGVTRYIEDHDTETDAVVVVGGYAAVAIEVYYEGPARLFGIPPDTRILDTRNTVDLHALEILQQETNAYDRIWLVLWQDRIADPTNLVQSVLVEACHRLPVDASFTNVGLLLFDIRDCQPLDQLAAPALPLDVAFEQPIRLKGYNLIQQDRIWEVDLWWQTTGALDADYIVFVHLVDPNGTIVSQHDHIAGDDAYPTSQWRMGTRLRDRFFLEVGEETCQDCELRIGLYTLDRRLLLADGTETVTIPLPHGKTSPTSR